ncbi:MAG: hypothetical protein EHM49_07465 [Deltaproteobacteria bacterium]|nr:MAG: hypothetical protein EHM49_07465 [Deltaproteobacteria bacterium]
MNENTLQITIQNAFYRCVHLLHRKGREYSPDEDRLSNFKKAATLQKISPEEALFGMLAKHLVSLSDLCRAITCGMDWSQAFWEEKITDSHNYLFLLEALLKERYRWQGPEDQEGPCVL